MENTLQAVESDLAPKYENLVNKIRKHEHLDTQDRATLAYVAANFYLRCEPFRNWIIELYQKKCYADLLKFLDDPKKLGEYLESTKHENASLLFGASEEIRTGAIKLEIKIDNIPHLQAIFLFMDRIASVFFHKYCKLYLAVGAKQFITSDNPVVDVCPYTRVEVLQNSQLKHIEMRRHVFPLAPDICAVFEGGRTTDKLPTKVISDSFIGEINTVITALSVSRVFAVKKSDL